MSNTLKGFVVIADISGYTRYLSQSELDHAQEVLQSLLELLIDNTKIPLRISRLEGDAVISYATEGSLLHGATLLDLVESSYVAFRRALELMVINTTCTCNACRNISTLDLKFFIHFGSFGLQELAAYTELIGTDVNLVHRLTKNHVVETTGLRAYALFTREAIEALGLQEWANGMATLTESYEHIGDVEIFVQDMQSVWEQERERSRIMVKEEEAILIMEHKFPVTPFYLWDYLLKPEFRALFIGSDTAEAKHARKGRIGEGTIYQCAHGKLIHPQTIVDWQPFETHTILDALGLGMTTNVSYYLSPNPEGTRLKIVVGPVHSNNRLKRAVASQVLKLMWRVMGPKGVRNLRQKIEQDLVDGKTILPERVAINLDEIRNSIQAALAAPDKR